MTQLCRLVLVALCATFLVPVFSAPTDSKPKVTLLYESLCPGCHQFILTQLHPAYTKLQDHIDIELVPFGNAHERTSNGREYFQCQHGQNECYGNFAQACAIDMLKSQKASLEFVYCMTSYSLSESTEKTSRECAKKHSIDVQKLEACIQGSQGDQLMDKLAKRTDHFRNAVRSFYVPWVIINEQHQDQARSDLLGYLCDNYFYNKNIPACE